MYKTTFKKTDEKSSLVHTNSHAEVHSNEFKQNIINF